MLGADDVVGGVILANFPAAGISILGKISGSPWRWPA
jgi:hypothetical protein